jgi:hypothetical protein
LILCVLMNLTISAPSIKLSISMLFCILHIVSILTGPNIFLGICLTKMRRLFSSFAVKVQVSDEYVTTGITNLLHPPKFKPRIVQPVTDSLYRL